jgi:hypothetical protein
MSDTSTESRIFWRRSKRRASGKHLQAWADVYEPAEKVSQSVVAERSTRQLAEAIEIAEEASFYIPMAVVGAESLSLVRAVKKIDPESYARKEAKPRIILLQSSYKSVSFDWLPMLAPTEPADEKAKIPGSWLTHQTVHFVVEEMRKAGNDERDAKLMERAVSLIQEAVTGLLTTISNSLIHVPDQRSQFLLGIERFENSVARALVFRIPMDFYCEAPFVEALYNDFKAAVAEGRFQHKRWRTALDEDGRVTLKAEPLTKNERIPEIEGWKKGRAIRLSKLADE